mmetsp:Transcript_49090/g.117695  ORF Transcript_49090/g.117695 Transcript_49090/m.117695 type:complete len:383 (-) Transcript_49090:694-1842(-)
MPPLAVGRSVPVVVAGRAPTHQRPLACHRQCEGEQRGSVLRRDVERDQHPRHVHEPEAPPDVRAGRHEGPPREEQREGEGEGAVRHRKRLAAARHEGLEPRGEHRVARTPAVERPAKRPLRRRRGRRRRPGLQQQGGTLSRADALGPCLQHHPLCGQPPATEQGVAADGAPRQQHAPIRHVCAVLDADRQGLLAVTAHDDTPRPKHHVVTNLEQVILHQPLEPAPRPVHPPAHLGPEHPQDRADAAIVRANQLRCLVKGLWRQHPRHQPVLEQLPPAPLPLPCREPPNHQPLDGDAARQPHHRQRARPDHAQCHVVSHPVWGEEPLEHVPVALKVLFVPRLQAHALQNQQEGRLLHGPHHEEEEEARGLPAPVGLGERLRAE